ncbi:MAG TPA: CapA family protein, partial [Bacteroidia bacterium]
NFCTYGRFNLKGINGIAPILKLNMNKKGEFMGGKIYSIKQEGEGGPTPDSTNAVVRELKKLTKEDFPETQLKISDDGKIDAIKK